MRILCEPRATVVLTLSVSKGEPPPPGQWVAEPNAPSRVNLPFGNQDMEASMAYVRLQSTQHRRRPVRASVVVLALGAWLALGLISQAAFQLIG